MLHFLLREQQKSITYIRRLLRFGFGILKSGKLQVRQKQSNVTPHRSYYVQPLMSVYVPIVHRWQGG